MSNRQSRQTHQDQVDGFLSVSKGPLQESQNALLCSFLNSSSSSSTPGRTHILFSSCDMSQSICRTQRGPSKLKALTLAVQTCITCRRP